MSDSDIEVTAVRSAFEPVTHYCAKVSDHAILLDRMPDAIYHMICERIADRYVEENFPAIAARLDQNAIANLAIAEASKKIAEEIQRQPIVVGKVKTEVYQRGVLGSIRRIK